MSVLNPDIASLMTALSLNNLSQDKSDINEASVIPQVQKNPRLLKGLCNALADMVSHNLNGYYININFTTFC